MADKQDLSKKKLLKAKGHETVRERANKQSVKKDISDNKLRHKIYRPLSVLGRFSSKEFNVIPLPENKAGKVLGKSIHVRRLIMPKFFREAWAELKKVFWPNRREAVRLTGAVVVFAVVFAVFVQILGIIFQKLVKKIILKS